MPRGEGSDLQSEGLILHSLYVVQDYTHTQHTLRKEEKDGEGPQASALHKIEAVASLLSFKKPARG